VANAEKIIAELAANVTADALERREISPFLRTGVRVYRQVSLFMAGAEFGVHLAIGNYPYAALIVVRQAGLGIAAKLLVEGGGLLARISSVDDEYKISAKMLSARYRVLPTLNIVSLMKMSLEEQKKNGDEKLREATKAAQEAEFSDEQARVAASRVSKLIVDTDSTIETLRFFLPLIGPALSKLRPSERLGARRYDDGLIPTD